MSKLLIPQIETSEHAHSVEIAHFLNKSNYMARAKTSKAYKQLVKMPMVNCDAKPGKSIRKRI